MEKSKEQILIEKLRKVSHKVRMGQMMRPCMPPMNGAGQPGFPGGMCRRGHHGPGGMQPPMDNPGHCGMQPPQGRPCHGGMGPHAVPHGPGMMPPPMMEHCGQHRGPVMPREMLLLAVLENGENGIRQKDLADRIGINASSLSEQIDRLETDRYLERRENPEDKRSTLIVLTEKGKARAWEVQDERRKTAEQFCARLTDAEKDTLIGLLDKLLAE